MRRVISVPYTTRKETAHFWLKVEYKNLFRTKSQLYRDFIRLTAGKL
jgi:hypothetical protein